MNTAFIAGDVQENLGERISLATAADVAGLEPTYFSRFFPNKTGVCSREFLAWSRVERACRLLRRSNESITEVGACVGFGDLRTFERVFRRCLGMTPSEYKRRYRPDAHPPDRTSG